MKTYIFKANSAEGFGGKAFYTERVKVEDNIQAMNYAKMQFALRYGVEIESIMVSEVK